MISFVWSKNALYLQWLAARWRTTDGFSEEEIATAEAELGIQLPVVLRGFYRYWGTRHQVNESLEGIARPDALYMRAGVVIFVFENQGVFIRGVRSQDLANPDPPVYLAYNDWRAPSTTPLEWHRTHEHVSDYLDALTFLQDCERESYGPLGPVDEAPPIGPRVVSMA